ncbi:MAG: nitrile hydratase accessory protein [Chloroflexi bacterium]|nr:nitrile hydratase accessory protein [Chloroflexota bacterium]
MTASVYERNRNIVTRGDGRKVNVARFRGQLFVCSLGCCCGQTKDGFAPVPAARFHQEWEKRRLRNIVHLTIGGCLGPCGLANVVLLMIDGQSLWFHSINSEALVPALYDYVERLLVAEKAVPPDGMLAGHQFTAASWQPRPDGQAVDDYRPRRPHPTPLPSGEGVGSKDGAPLRLGSGTPLNLTKRQAAPRPTTEPPAPEGQAPAPAGSDVPVLSAPSLGRTSTRGGWPSAGGVEGLSRSAVDRAIVQMEGSAALPRKNGELVFEEPWHGRAFGMAVSLHERGLYGWDEFRDELIAQIRSMEARGGMFAYYEAWLAALERVLECKGLVGSGELEEVTYQYEFGERDDVY